METGVNHIQTIIGVVPYSLLRNYGVIQHKLSDLLGLDRSHYFSQPVACLG